MGGRVVKRGEKGGGRVVGRGERWGLVTLRWITIPSWGGVVILLVASCYGNRDLRSPMHRQN